MIHLKAIGLTFVVLVCLGCALSLLNWLGTWGAIFLLGCVGVGCVYMAILTTLARREARGNDGE